jgi:hypothetical protein
MMNSKSCFKLKHASYKTWKINQNFIIYLYLVFIFIISYTSNVYS